MTSATHEIGEWSTEAPVTEEMKKICIEMKPGIVSLVDHHFDCYIPLTFRRKCLMGGTHTLVNVYVGVNECVHAMIIEMITQIKQRPTVKGVQYPKTACQPLIPFEVKH